MLTFRFLFREPLSLSLVVGDHFLLFLVSQIQKQHSMDDLLKLLKVFLITVLLKPSFLRQQKADLEQYPLALTSTKKSSADHPLDSIVVFKDKYLWILVLCQYSMFSSQGHVMSVTFLKALENIVISRLS